MKNNKKGKLFVIEGIDGSGKATQTKLLIKRLKKEGYRTATIGFPQYYNNFFGEMIGRFLNGEFGDAPSTNPYLASVLYAADRWESKNKINKWLQEGRIVVLDRYVSSNQIHQGGKIKDTKKRKQFLKWLEEMEFKIFKIPKPETIVFLNVPYNISKNLVKNKSSRSYLKNSKSDKVEKNCIYQELSHKQSLKLIKDNNNWIKIDCVKNGKIRNMEEISDLIWNKIEKYLKKQSIKSLTRKEVK